LSGVLALSLAACAGGPPPVPYPAFIDVDELPDAFVAGLPGVRAKILSGDPRTQRASSRIALPADWSFTTGASPAQSVEIYVLAGALTLGEFELTEGGYAYIPPGSSGLQMKSDRGALLLYFLDEANPAAVIQTPLITNSSLIDWQPTTNDVGDRFWVRELRRDPGSGAVTWLQREDAFGLRGWRRTKGWLEGYLLTGAFVESECVAGEGAVDEYLPGSYLHRPPGAVFGGKETGASGEAIWFFRAPADAEVEPLSDCQATLPDPR